MDTVWQIAAYALIGVVGVSVVDVLLSGQRLRAIRPWREILHVLLAAAATGYLALLADGGPSPGVAAGVAAAATVVGYLVSTASGYDAAFGTAFTIGSRVFLAAWGVGGIVVTLGVLGLGAAATTAGVTGLIGATAYGAGQLIHQLGAHRTASLVFDAELEHAHERRCIACEIALRPNLRFCTVCGAEQPFRCESCSERNPATSRFCTACGASAPGRIPAPRDDAVGARSCILCRARISVEAAYCRACGLRQPAPCSLCGGPLLPGAADCDTCGIDLELAEEPETISLIEARLRASAPAESVCPGCGTLARAGTRFCTECGTALTATGSTAAPA